jgi:aminoglycoside phosphotransferase (APT) family kinase protein
MTPSTGDEAPGPLLARGRAADVYALGGDRVLRRYRRSAPFDTAREARLVEHVRAHGYPTPAVHDVRGNDIVFDRVEGPTMADQMMARPWLIRSHLRTLAALHARLHDIPAPAWLDHEPAGAGTAIVHLDLHPLNVLMAPTGAVVIDWTNAGRGRGEVDVALTWLLLTTGSPDDRRAMQVVASLAQRFIGRVFARAADPSGDALRTQLATAARYRLTDPNLREGERRAINRLVKTTT